jgi:phosphate transport system permease protein
MIESRELAGRHLDADKEAARVRARYRAEARFRAYGFAALLLAAAFLLVVLVDILLKGLPAFWQHSLIIDVEIRTEEVDPQGQRNLDQIRAADYFELAREALLASIPVEGRAAQRQVTNVLSIGAADRLRDRVIADPDLIGRHIATRLTLSDDADLYLKGGSTPIGSRSGSGTATPSDRTGEVTITTSGSTFADELALVKAELAGRAREAPAVEGAEVQLDGSVPSRLVAIGGGLVKITHLGPASATGEVLLPLASVETAGPGAWRMVTYGVPEAERRVSDQQVAVLEHLSQQGRVVKHFNWQFFTSSDSREPELAGILGALVGSALTLTVTLVLCVPIGVLAAIYLEEFAPRGRLTDLVEVNINNLAAVPSIVFGLLGLAVFLNFFGLPRSAPLVGGLVLALLVLPTIIIAARAALKAVPPSIKEGALAIGASHQQAVFQHVVPLAMPGILTGTIIGMAHALGETAPLLMIGMVAFIADVPKGFSDAATALPVQVYLWSDLPELAFQQKTAAAIIVLLVFLFLMNGLAIWLRRKFEKRW